MSSSLSFAAEAVNNPSRYYQRPRQVVQDRRLSRNEKMAILEAWEVEARSLSDTAEDGPNGGEPTLLAEVEQARLQLNEKTDADDRHGAPARPVRRREVEY